MSWCTSARSATTYSRSRKMIRQGTRWPSSWWHSRIMFGQAMAATSQRSARNVTAKRDCCPACLMQNTLHSVIVVSSFRLVREAVRALIERDQTFHVIAEAEDRTDTLRVVTDLRPDLVLFDLDPDYAATIETIRLLIRNRP